MDTREFKKKPEDFSGKGKGEIFLGSYSDSEIVLHERSVIISGELKMLRFNEGQAKAQDDDNSIRRDIAQLREEGYEALWRGNKRYLVRDASASNAQTMHPNETKIQALRYLQGMELIYDGIRKKAQLAYLTEYSQVFKKYVKQDEPLSATAVHQMAEEFALIIANYLKVDIEKARKQVTMARDLGILFEDHPGIVTVSKSGKQKTVEVSANIQVSNDYYDNVFGKKNKVGQQKWFANAKKFAGINQSQRSWLEVFFENHYEEMVARGVPAPPSARWLPLPGNVQDVETHTFDMDERDEVNPKTKMSTSFKRMGTSSAFDIDDVDEQKRLAKEILKEVIKSSIDRDLKTFKELYGDLAKEEPFLINYQTLLSPHYFESLFYEKTNLGFTTVRHKDNNAAFVEMAKEAISEIESEIKDQYSDQRFEFYQTNSAVNKLAGLPTIKEYPEDTRYRNAKLTAVANILKKVDGRDSKLVKMISGEVNIPGVIQLDRELEQLRNKMSGKEYTPQLINEMLMRVNAAIHLRLLLKNEMPYKAMDKYQHNIMQASLELLTQGAQGMNIIGCKSARDRTAVLAAAIKTMKENPHAMDNWNTLNRGITESLVQGHHFHAMSYHVAMVKVSDVHSDFVERLPMQLQSDIKQIKPLSKSLDEVETRKAENRGKQKEKSPKKSLSKSADSAPRVYGHVMLSIAKSPKRELEDVSIKILAKLQATIETTNWSVVGGSLFGGRRVSIGDKKMTVPSHVAEMLNQIELANRREQSFGLALMNVAVLAASAQSEYGFGLLRAKNTQDFYKNVLTSLNIDVKESLKSIHQAIFSHNWKVTGLLGYEVKFDNRITKTVPLHIKLILDEIARASRGNNENSLDKQLNALNNVLAIVQRVVADPSGGGLSRRDSTKAFYASFPNLLVLEKEGSSPKSQLMLQ